MAWLHPAVTAHVQVPAFLGGDDPDVFALSLGTFAGAAGDAELHFVRGADAFVAVFQFHAEADAVANAVAAPGAAPWLDNMEGGIDYLRSVIIDDKLGLNDHLEEELARLRAAFACEWTETVNNPAAQTRFKHFINSDQRDPNVQVVPERDQHRPATPYERIPVTLVEEKA